MSSKYRSQVFARHVIAFSVSHQPDNLLARGMGFEHLRELVLRMARPILRHGASLAYSGHWKEEEENFTYILLRLINAEQEDNSFSGPDTSLAIGKLYNHCAWPHYLRITPKIEAQWINGCRIVRVTQEQAGLTHIVPDAEAENKEPRTLLNAAVTLSAMRRLMMEDMYLKIPNVAREEHIPPVIARILLGGKVGGYTGFLPGLFEEALVTLQHERPLYILGGFGGAAEFLAQAMLATGRKRPPELTLQWHKETNATLPMLLKAASQYGLPPGSHDTKTLLDALWRFILKARKSLAQTLNTGLSDPETRQLLTTRDTSLAVSLVQTGLQRKNKLPQLAA